MKTYVRAVTLVLAVLLLAATVCPTVAFADDSTKITKSNAINDAYYFWGAQMNTYSFSYYDGSSITMEQGGFALHYAGEDLTEIVGSPIAYCIEPNAGSTNGTTYSGTAAENSAYWNNKLSPDQREAIQLILLYGAPNALHSRNAKTLFGYEGATQILIWEIVMGLRSPLPPYTLNDSRMKDNFYGNQTFPSTKTAYDSILEKMRLHLTVPSFASVIENQAPTYELTYDASSGLYQGTLKDENKVLSKDYEFAAKGVSFTKDGNTLRISAPASAFSDGDIVASATGESLDPTSLTQMIWTLSKKQTVTTFSASPDPVVCYFKLHVKTEALEIIKTSTDGKVKGISFQVEQKTGNSWKNLGTFQTDKNGKISVPDLKTGTVLRVSEIVPDGCVCTSENPQTITIRQNSSGSSNVNTVFFENTPKGTMNGFKYDYLDHDKSQKGYVFKIENLDTKQVWYGVVAGAHQLVLANSSGKPIQADGSLAASSDDYVYTFKGLVDGHYRFTELISKSTGADQNVFPHNWTLEITAANGTVKSTNFRASLVEDDNGDCVLTPKNPITGLTGGGKLSMYIYNEPKPGNMSLYKYTTDDPNAGNISASHTGYSQAGYRFRIKNTDTGDIWYGKVATNRLYLTEEDGTPVLNSSGGYVYKFTGLKDGTYEITELLSVSENADRNVKPTAWNITVVDSNGTTTYNEEFGSSVRQESNGDYSVTASNVTGISGGGTMTMTIQNTPLPRTVTVWKISTDGKVKGISFRVEKKNGSKWKAIGTYTTNAAGKLDIPAQEIGTVLRITEIIPDNYICLSENPQQITVSQDESQNTVSFENTPMGNMRAYKYTTDDPNAGNISASHAGYSQKGYLFKFENLDNSTTFYGKAVVNRLALANASGQFLNKDGGIKTDSDAYVYTFPGMLDGHYRFTELISLSDDNVSRDVKPTRWEILVEDHDGETRHDLVFGKSITAEDNGGSYFISPTTRLTGLTGGGTLTMIVSNKTTKKPVAVQKSSADGKIDGIEFVVRDSANQVVFRGLTDADGILNTPKLTIGEAYSFEEIVPEGYVCTSDNPQTITLSAGVNRVLFSNEPVPSGSISIRKVNEKYRALSKVTFLLEYSRDAGKTWKPVKHRDNNDPVKIGYCTSDRLNNGTLATDRNGFASFNGLSLDAELRYRLTEISTKPGYSLLTGPAFEGPITGMEPEIELTVVNLPFFQIPLTGGRGFAMTSLVVFAVGSAALALLLVLKKRRGLGV